MSELKPFKLSDHPRAAKAFQEIAVLLAEQAADEGEYAAPPPEYVDPHEAAARRVLAGQSDSIDAAIADPQLANRNRRKQLFHRIEVRKRVIAAKQQEFATIASECSNELIAQHDVRAHAVEYARDIHRALQQLEAAIKRERWLRNMLHVGDIRWGGVPPFGWMHPLGQSDDHNSAINTWRDHVARDYPELVKEFAAARA